jgi:hypothetical protein
MSALGGKRIRFELGNVRARIFAMFTVATFILAARCRAAQKSQKSHLLRARNRSRDFYADDLKERCGHGMNGRL